MPKSSWRAALGANPHRSWWVHPGPEALVPHQARPEHQLLVALGEPDDLVGEAEVDVGVWGRLRRWQRRRGWPDPRRP
ncbi:MAG: hypothetical protein ACR2KL_13905 [Nocardioidaceae bacterium]